MGFHGGGRRGLRSKSTVVCRYGQPLNPTQWQQMRRAFLMNIVVSLAIQ